MHPFLAAFIVTSAAAAAALPTGTVLAELSNALSAHDVLENTAESTVGSITSITGLESPHFATAGTIVPEAALVELNPLPSPSISPSLFLAHALVYSVDDGNSGISTQVITAIVVCLIIFLALHVILFCFRRKIGCFKRRVKARAPLDLPYPRSLDPLYPPKHVTVTISPTPARQSSGSTLVSDNEGWIGDPVRDSADVPSLEMLPRAASPFRGRQGRPREPLTEGAA